MAKFTIERLNYMTTGRNRMFLNVDRRLSQFPNPVRVLAKKEDEPDQPSALISLECESQPKDILELDDYRNSPKYIEWLRRYIKNNTTPNTTFDIEFDQTDQDINQTDKFNPMYDMVDVHIKSDLGNRKDNFEKFDNKQNQCEDMYNPDLTDNPVQFCKIGQKTYMMTTPTKYESQIIDVKFKNAELGKQYVPNLENQQHRTFFYAPVSDLTTEDGLSVNSFGEYFGSFSGNSDKLQRMVDQYFGDTREISGVQYNHLLALDHTNSQKWSIKSNMNEYGNGNVYAGIYSLKNTYDSMYSVNMDSPTTINNSREYCGILESRGKAYLKYMDDITITPGDDGNTRNLTPQKRTWQKIETMEPASVGYQSSAKHKSLYYSIRLNETGLSDDDIKNNSGEKNELEAIKKDIENSIRDIAMKFAPANTQLFEIQIED